jgi:hypothetical protein
MQSLLEMAAQAQRLVALTAPARAAWHSGRRRSMQADRPRGAQRQASRPRARRTSSSSRTSSCDPGSDGEPPPPPPRLTLWRHPRFGSATPNLLRLLVRQQAEEASR